LGEHLSHLGELLRTTRQKRHLSLPDVALATRINVMYLEALESEDYSLLPGQAYITGFLRNYGRFLGLHPDDLVQEFYSAQPIPPTTVKPATRVLASGHERHNRRRLFWTLASVAMLMLGAYTIKHYNDTHAAPAPQLALTPANLGASTLHPKAKPHAVVFRIGLRATAPVWIRVTTDSKRVFQGYLNSTIPLRTWSGYYAIYVMTNDGTRLRVRYNGRPMGLMAHKPQLLVDMATRTGWRVAT